MRWDLYWHTHLGPKASSVIKKFEVKIDQT